MTWRYIGNDWAVRHLCNHVAQGLERHAYLFSGPPGVGRRTLALKFIQALNCKDPPEPGVPCGSCSDCRQIERMQHPDLFVVRVEPGNRDIKIDQVRALQHNLSLTPFSSRYRVGLLLNFQEASTGASNALLKTLEEAPPHAILLLTADDPEGVLPTIASRCEILRLRPLPLGDLQAALETGVSLPPQKPGGEAQSIRLEPEEARLLAHLASGRPGEALRLAADDAGQKKRLELLDDLVALTGASRRDRFIYAERLAREKETLRQALLTWLSGWRDVFLLAAGSQAPLANPDREAGLRRVASTLDLGSAQAQVQAIQRALRGLDQNLNPRLLTEALLLDWPRT